MNVKDNSPADFQPLKSIADRRIRDLGLGGLEPLAARFDMPYTTLNNYINGRRVASGVYVVNEPSARNRSKLARALGMREEEITYLFTVVSDDREGQWPDSPLYMDLEAELLKFRFQIGDDIRAFAKMNGLIPEVLEAVYYGGRDTEGRLVHPPVGTLEDIADVLGKSRTALMRRYLSRSDTNPMFFTEVDLEKATVEEKGEPYPLKGDQPVMKPLPVYVAGWVGAGPDENELLEEETVWVEDRFARGKELVAFKIRGDSMAAGRAPIFDGDLVIVNQKDKGHDGAAVVARLQNEGYVCKRLKDDRFGWHLVSANPDYTNGTPPYIGADQVAQLVGKVVRVIHDAEDPSS